MPGPLESRRRLGKRQIGGLNALQNPSGLPDWSLPVIDLSKWSWEPPTPFSLRQEKLHDSGQPSGWVSVALPRWLAEWIEPNNEEPETQAAGATEGQNPVLHSTNPVEVLDGFQSLVYSRPLDELVLACKALCNRLGDDARLVAGLAENKEEVLDALDNVWVALDARSGLSSDDALFLFAQFYSSALASQFTTPTSPHHTLGTQLSHRLLAQLAKLPASDQLCELLQLAMKAVAPNYSADIEPLLLSILNKFFISWSQGTPSQGQTQLISDALSMLDPSAANALRKKAELVLLEQSQPPERMCYARYAWLGIVARVSAFKFPTFKSELQLLFEEPSMAATISSRDICELLLAQWTTHGKLQHPKRVRDIFSSMSAQDDPISFGALSHALYTCERHWADQLLQLRQCLKVVGRVGEIPASFIELRRFLLQQEHTIHPRLLRKLVPICQDYRVALRLHELYTELPAPSKGGQWDSSVWEQYLEAAVADHSTHPADVCKLLKLCKKNEHTTIIAAKLATSFAHADGLSDRAALRYVTECKTFLQRGGDKLPQMALDAIYRVVSRDLTRGEMGRTARLRWLVNTVHREGGPEMAEKAAVMLRGWRINVKKVQVREQRQLEKEDREREFDEQVEGEESKKASRRKPRHRHL